VRGGRGKSLTGPAHSLSGDEKTRGKN